MVIFLKPGTTSGLESGPSNCNAGYCVVSQHIFTCASFTSSFYIYHNFIQSTSIYWSVFLYLPLLITPFLCVSDEFLIVLIDWSLMYGWGCGLTYGWHNPLIQKIALSPLILIFFFNVIQFTNKIFTTTWC